MSWVELSSEKLHTFLYFSNLSARKSLQMPDISRCFFFYKCQSMKSLMNYIWNKFNFPHWKLWHAGISYLRLLCNHSQRSKVLLKALVSARWWRLPFVLHLLHTSHTLSVVTSRNKERRPELSSIKTSLLWPIKRQWAARVKGVFATRSDSEYSRHRLNSVGNEGAT